MELLCYDCPRRCGARRSETLSGGVCQSPLLPCVIRAAPHFGEEPCISGSRGAGTVFFTGCSLHCVYCQNAEISRKSVGKALRPDELREVMLRLRDKGVHNIELVTPSHYTRVIAEALSGAELGVPVVWNSSGYERAETLRMLYAGSQNAEPRNREALFRRAGLSRTGKGSPAGDVPAARGIPSE